MGLVGQYRKFEGLKLRLADRTTYSPDFVVWHLDNSIELVETKGYWQEDAKVKFKIARELFPCFRFTAIKRNKGGWESAINSPQATLEGTGSRTAPSTRTAIGGGE